MEYKLITTVEGCGEDINDVLKLVVGCLKAQTFHIDTILDGMEAYVETHQPQ